VGLIYIFNKVILSVKVVLGVIKIFKNPIPNLLQLASGERKEMLRR